MPTLSVRLRTILSIARDFTFAVNKTTQNSSLNRPRFSVIIGTLVALTSLNAHAHLLKVFAFTQLSSDPQTMTTQGKVYFAGGTGVANLPLEILDNQGKKVKTLSADSAGKFQFDIAKGKYQLVANTQDGHIAKWNIAPPKAAISNQPLPTVDQTDELNKPQHLSQADQAKQQIMMAELISAQIQPLAEQLNALEERTRIQDIFGALGYIFGLYGFAIWWRQRKEKAPTN